MDLRGSDSLRIRYITLSLPCGEQKRHNPKHENIFSFDLYLCARVCLVFAAFGLRGQS